MTDRPLSADQDIEQIPVPRTDEELAAKARGLFKEAGNVLTELGERGYDIAVKSYLGDSGLWEVRVTMVKTVYL